MRPKITNDDESPIIRILAIAASTDLFSSGGSQPDTYVTILVGEHQENWPIRSEEFIIWLKNRYFRQYRILPSSSSFKDAIDTLDAKARFERGVDKIGLRYAMDAKTRSIYIDLVNEGWEVLKVNRHGWKRIKGCDCPIRFIRHRGMLPLPTPTPNGSLSNLRYLLNIPSDDDWKLLVAWIIGAMNPSGPYPVLVISGEQGTAKSTLCRILRLIIDPNEAPLRRPPRSERDLMIAANNSWIVGFDNVSNIKADLSDALCSLATGVSFSTRKLYTDYSEQIFSAKRPIILNGISDVVSRPDLLDRSICINLQRISTEKRCTEKKVMGEFNKIHPGLFGAILDIISAGLGNTNAITSDLPRMADFTNWVLKCAPKLKWKESAFIHALDQNRREAMANAIESSAIGTPLIKFIHKQKKWTGTISDLLDILSKNMHPSILHSREWPKTPRKMGAELDRLAPDLREARIIFSRIGHDETGTRRLISLRLRQSSDRQKTKRRRLRQSS